MLSEQDGAPERACRTQHNAKEVSYEIHAHLQKTPTGIEHYPRGVRPVSAIFPVNSDTKDVGLALPRAIA